MSKSNHFVPEKIFLIGYMGSGKTTVGVALAKLLGWYFLDLDTEIEKQEKKSIGEIFSLYGEEAFREIESKVLRTLKNIHPTVIATGGGTAAFHDNLAWMNNVGSTVYLRTHPGTLFHRLAPVKATRPLISNLPDVDVMEFILENIKKRLPYYVQAKHTVSGEESPTSVARTIQLLLS
ncbi:shikimate kinase [soil metagenome]